MKKYIAGALVFMAVLFTSNYFIALNFSEKKIGSAGEFGDIFGFSNAIMTSLAFIGLIVTIFMQKSELELQRQELRETRDEIAGQRTELKNQNRFFQRQIFENRLLNLLRSFRECRDSLNFTIDRGVHRGERVHESINGLKVFKIYNSELSQIIAKFLENQNQQRFIKGIQEKEKEHRYMLAGYYRTLTLIVKEVETGGNMLSDIELLRCQLQEAEMLWLFYISFAFKGDFLFDNLRKVDFFRDMLEQKYINELVRVLYESEDKN